MSKQHYFEPEFKKQIVQLYLQGRTIKSLNDEYRLGDGTVANWVKKYREECENNPVLNDEKLSLEEIKRLRKELEELKKENAFLKKAAAFFAREID